MDITQENLRSVGFLTLSQPDFLQHHPLGSLPCTKISQQCRTSGNSQPTMYALYTPYVRRYALWICMDVPPQYALQSLTDNFLFCLKHLNTIFVATQNAHATHSLYFSASSTYGEPGSTWKLSVQVCASWAWLLVICKSKSDAGGCMCQSLFLWLHVEFGWLLRADFYLTKIQRTMLGVVNYLWDGGY